MTLLPSADEKSRSFTSLQLVHTHTLPQEGGKIKVRTNEMKMTMKGHENDVKMKMR